MGFNLDFLNQVKRYAAEYFRPHIFQTKTVLLGYGVPHIKIAFKAYQDMYYIATASGREEISWLGTVKKEGNVYTIEEVMLFEQEVEVAETAMSPADIAMVTTNLLVNGEIEKVNMLKFWGHVHPGNSTSPSHQDEIQMDVLSNGNEWFLRGIFGREGRAEFTFFDWERGVRFNDVSWEVIMPEDESREDDIRTQVANKVKKILPTTTYDFSRNRRHKSDLLCQEEQD